MLACRIFVVSESGFHAQRHRAPSARSIRHAALTESIGRVHLDTRGTYGARRVHAELTLGHGLSIGRCAVELLMHRAGIAGVSGRPRFRRIAGVATASDLVERRFWRDEPDRLWVTDITEHPTREGKLYCAVVLDVSPVGWCGWSIDSVATAALVTNALGMAIEGRGPDGTVIHSDQGTGVHVLGVHAAGARLGAHALDGLGRELLRQRDDRVVLESDAGRTAGPTDLADASGARERHLRVPRGLP